MFNIQIDQCHEDRRYKAVLNESVIGNHNLLYFFNFWISGIFNLSNRNPMKSFKLVFTLVFFTCLTHVFSQTLLKDVNDYGDVGSSPMNWCAVSEERFIFQAVKTLETETLFSSDGTEEGTFALGTYQVDTDIIRFRNKAYFGGCDVFSSADSCTSLYVSDGTVEGTSFFVDLVPGGLSLGIEDIVAGDSLFFFSGHTPGEGVELWRSNGTVTGTFRVADIATGSMSGYQGELTVINDIAYFAGFTAETGIEAWRSDGTDQGTYLIADLNEGAPSGFPSGFTASGGYIYFGALGTSSGFEVRRIMDGQSNVETIGEMGGSTDSSVPREFVDSDGKLFWVAEGEDAAGFDLWVYSHTGEAQHLEFSTGDIFPRALIPFGQGEVIFNAEDNEGNGRELWRSDGTLVGTRLIIDLYPGEMDGVFGTGTVGGSFYVLDDSLVYFAGADGVNASGEFVYELFVSDGTAEGTQLVSDQFPGMQGSNPGDFFEFGDRLYFAATDPIVGREPFYLDTEVVSSTGHIVRDINISKSVFPNPVYHQSLVWVEVVLDHHTELQAQIFDLMGRPAQNVQNLGDFPAGTHKLNINMNSHPAGIYLLKIRGKESETSQLIIIN